jgi:hypothetical protein
MSSERNQVPHLTPRELHRLVDAAAVVAKLPADVGAVKYARELVIALEKGAPTYRHTAEVVLRLQQITSPPAVPLDQIEPSARVGLYFVRSSRDASTYWRTTAHSCTCEAGRYRNADCKHQTAVRALMPKAPESVASDPFARVRS